MAKKIKVGDWIYAERSRRRGIVVEIAPFEYIVDFKIIGINPNLNLLRTEGCLKEYATRICSHCKKINCLSIEE